MYHRIASPRVDARGLCGWPERFGKQLEGLRLPGDAVTV